MMEEEIGTNQYPSSEAQTSVLPAFDWGIREETFLGKRL
jgi:hypothetical protein